MVGQLLPKKHTLKLVYQYNANIAFSENWLQLSKYDWRETSSDGWITCTTRCVGTTVYSGGNLEFSTALQPPFNGTLSITAGVSDTDVFNAGVQLYPLNDFTTPESATLTVYRDGEQVNQVTIKSPKAVYHFFMYFQIDGLGNISHWVDETSIRKPVATE